MAKKTDPTVAMTTRRSQGRHEAMRDCVFRLFEALQRAAWVTTAERSGDASCRGFCRCMDAGKEACEFIPAQAGKRAMNLEQRGRRTFFKRARLSFMSVLGWNCAP